MAHSSEVLPAPLRSLLPGVAVENGEESLTANTTEGHDDGMCVFHGPARSFGVCHGTLEGEMRGQRHVRVVGYATMRGYRSNTTSGG